MSAGELEIIRSGIESTRHLFAEVKRLRMALEFYADPSLYDLPVFGDIVDGPSGTMILVDRGKVAREALSSYSDELPTIHL